MSISAELFYAILAMDSYNRGYNPGIAGIGDVGSTINNAVVLTDSETVAATKDEAQAASFYAVAYQTADGIVISYRGTDNFAVDPVTGWTTGASLLTSQVKLAAEFYYAVKQQYPSASITLTGHSLGGGLAGFMAKQAVGCASAHHSASAAGTLLSAPDPVMR